jgi:soluble lytic murein transglycosylase-like protein
VLRALWSTLWRFCRFLHRRYRSCSPRTRRRVLVWACLVTVATPIWLINLAVAFFGQTVVFPLSPFFLRQKLSALSSYGVHRPLCFLREHPELAPLVASAGRRERLPGGLLAAVIHIESGGRPHRISSAGAMGLGQLMPGTARDLAVVDPFDSTANVEGAARLLARHIARFRSVRLALAAYHAGPGSVRSRRVPDNGVTVQYVNKVMRVYASLRARPDREPGTLPGALPRLPGPLFVSGTW